MVPVREEEEERDRRERERELSGRESYDAAHQWWRYFWIEVERCWQFEMVTKHTVCGGCGQKCALTKIHLSLGIGGFGRRG